MLKSHGTPVFRGCGCIGVAPQAEILPFSVAPIEAINFLKKKVDVPTATWTDLWQQEHSRSFTVAGAMTESLVADFHETVVKAIEQGETLETFRKDFDAIVERHGWSYNGTSRWRSRVIFDTNMSTAYAAGRWDQVQRVKRTRPYLMYRHLEGQRFPRPIHQSWDGTILPVEHPWWQTHYPPNGWGCHCWVESLSDDDLRRYGYRVSKDAPPSPLIERTVELSDGTLKTIEVPEGIDPGFAYRPGEMPASIDEALNE
ncbi:MULTISPECIES: phage minor head protein [unclassified Bradyrhizobium]|uniref:phage head morphogenesis protein n=1 Tax=unclassified Bradyrhizobium TaxID=2631580 RepID=UPI002915D7FE|nr:MULTISPECIES: phage minor head protein [unclassified Bradyrhizobium]